MDQIKLRAELTRDEGLKLQAYQDTLGFWTIGVGHLLGKTQRMIEITVAEAEALLDADIESARNLAIMAVPKIDFMNDVRQRALVNMAFNRGRHLLQSTKILPALIHGSETGDWSRVAPAIQGSEWASQVGKRADRLAIMFATGKEPV